MTLIEGLILIAAGVAAGFLNIVAGGGSLITMPLLIFMGLPSADANASNRVALFIQNIFAVQGFKSKGVSVFPYAYWVAITATIGAILGAYIAVEISDRLFNRILALVMLGVMVLTVLKPMLLKNGYSEIFNTRRNALSIFLFFLVGIYGGFIQAGVGFLVIAVLVGVHGLSMAKTNSIKVFAILCYTAIAIFIFILEGKVQWVYGFTLAIGNATGAWIASRWSVNKDDKIIRAILLVSVTALSIKLWFFN